MTEKTDFITTNGFPIYSPEFVEKHRAQFRKTHNDYIAQVGGQENALKVNADIIFSGGNRGGGKANTYWTDVITPDGTKKMGKLEVGDKLCTPYDGIQTVEAIYEHGENNFYHIYFDDGTFVSVMDNHHFWARTTSCGDWKKMTAREIMDNYIIDAKYPQSLRKKATDYYEVPICGEIEFSENPKTQIDLPIHPYVLGVIMSNGTYHFSYRGAMVDWSVDSYKRIKMYGYYWRKLYGQSYIRGFRVKDRRAITKSRQEKESRIPKEYMLASAQARWEFIRGVMDAKGAMMKTHPYLELQNKKFIEDIAWVARSLGCWAKITTVNDGGEHDGWTRVTFKAPNDKDFFYRGAYVLKAHDHCDKPKSKDDRLMLSKKIIQVSKVKEKQKCRCITVSGKDHLYLTDAFTVNHNTVTLLMDAMYDINNPQFNATILRKEKDDLANIISESQLLYGFKGSYNKSKDDQTWTFNAGGKLKFNYFGSSVEDFADRFRGRQYAYIGIDEITQIEYEKFKTLTQTNRNGFGIRNRIVGTCNPDPLSWVRQFIDWWIGPDGYPISERDGVVRYCFMGGDTPEQVVWGSTRMEVYMQCKDIIDRLVSEKDKLPPEYMYVKSVTFVRAELDDNRALLDSSPEYKANLAQQSEEKVERDLLGNWNFMATGDDMVKMIHLQRCFQNGEMVGDHVRRCTCDVAFDGGDNLVMWLWIGYHVADVFTCNKDSQDTVNLVRAKLEEWRVAEENFCYDLNGVGQTLKGYFRRAKPFNNRQAVDEKYKGMYDNIKSQTFYLFARLVQEARISFEQELLSRKFSGKGFDGRPLRDVLQQERKCIRKDESKADQGWCIIKKEQMKKLCRHSPDFFEALAMRSYFDINTGAVAMPSWIKRRHPHLVRRRLS